MLGASSALAKLKDEKNAMTVQRSTFGTRAGAGLASRQAAAWLRVELLAIAACLFALVLSVQTASANAPKPVAKPERLSVGQSVGQSVNQAVEPAREANAASLATAAPSTPPPPPLVKPADIAVLNQRHDRLVYLPPVLQAQWQAYARYRDVKAFAVSVSGLNARPVGAFSVAHGRVATAIDGAITACEATARELGRPDDCEIFAIGDYVVFGGDESYDRLVIEAMESLKASGRVGRDAKGRIQKL